MRINSYRSNGLDYSTNESKFNIHIFKSIFLCTSILKKY